MEEGNHLAEQAISRVDVVAKIFDTFLENQYHLSQVIQHSNPSKRNEAPQYLLNRDMSLYRKYKRHRALPLVVTGPNSCGKSTFINTLLDAGVTNKILPAGMGSVTKRSVRLTYAPANRARVEVYKDIHGYFNSVRGACLEVEEFGKEWGNSQGAVVEKILLKHLEAPAVGEGETDCQNVEEWSKRMVVIHIPSDILKNVDIYDTPGPDLQHDTETLKENFSTLLQYLEPIAVTLFLVPNASVSPDVAKAHEMLMNVIHSEENISKRRPPAVFYINVKQSVMTMKNTDFISRKLEDEGIDVDEYDDLSRTDRKKIDCTAIDYARQENFRQFCSNLKNCPYDKEAKVDDCNFDVIDMLERNEAMRDHRTNVVLRIMKLAACHINKVSDFLLKAVCAAIYRFYFHILCSGRRSQDVLNRIVQRSEEFIGEIEEGFKDIIPIVKEYPRILADEIGRKYEEIMKRAEKIEIERREKRKVSQKAKIQEEMSGQLRTILYDVVVNPCFEQLKSKIREALNTAMDPILSDERFKSESEKNEVFNALRIEELKDFVQMFFPGLEQSLRTSGDSAIDVNVQQLMGSGPWNFLTRVIEKMGVIFDPLTLVKAIHQSFKTATDTVILSWVGEMVSSVEGKLREMARESSHETLVKSSIETVIVENLREALYQFELQEKTPQFDVATRSTLSIFCRAMDRIHFQALSERFGDRGVQELIDKDLDLKAFPQTVKAFDQPDDMRIQLKTCSGGDAGRIQLYADVLLSQLLKWMGVQAIPPIIVAFYVDPLTRKQPMYGLEVPFQTVVDLIEDKHPPQAEAALQVGYGLVKALYDLRSHGVTHVDVCSEGIYFSLCLETCVLDWTSVEIEGLPQANSSVTGSAEQPVIDHMSTRTNGENKGGVPCEYNLQFVGRLMHELYPGWVHGDMSDPASLDSEPCNCTYCNLKNLCLEAHESNKASVKEIKEEFEKHLPFKVPSDSPKGDEKDTNLPECNCRICTEKKRRQAGKEKRGNGVNRLVRGVEQNLSV